MWVLHVRATDDEPPDLTGVLHVLADAWNDIQTSYLHDANGRSRIRHLAHVVFGVGFLPRDIEHCHWMIGFDLGVDGSFDLEQIIDGKRTIDTVVTLRFLLSEMSFHTASGTEIALHDSVQDVFG